MIQYAKLTGRLYEGCVEVEALYGIVHMAKPVYSFPLIALPSEEWLTAYKDKFMAVIDFEQDKKERPLFLGVLPLDDVVIPDNFTNRRVFILSEKFKLTLDDQDDVFIVEQLNDAKQSVRIEKNRTIVKSESIFLGDESATEPMLLGQQVIDFLKDFLTEITQLTVPTGFGPSGFPLNSPKFLNMITQLTQLLSTVSKLV